MKVGVYAVTYHNKVPREVLRQHRERVRVYHVARLRACVLVKPRLCARAILRRISSSDAFLKERIEMSIGAPKATKHFV